MWRKRGRGRRFVITASDKCHAQPCAGVCLPVCAISLTSPELWALRCLRAHDVQLHFLLGVSDELQGLCGFDD